MISCDARPCCHGRPAVDPFAVPLLVLVLNNNERLQTLTALAQVARATERCHRLGLQAARATGMALRQQLYVDLLYRLINDDKLPDEAAALATGW